MKADANMAFAMYSFCNIFLNLFLNLVDVSLHLIVLDHCNMRLLIQNSEGNCDRLTLSKRQNVLFAFSFTNFYLLRDI